MPKTKRSATKRSTSEADSGNPSSNLENSDLIDRILADLTGIQRLQEFQAKLVNELKSQIRALHRRRDS
jgi:hypothetical protein